MKYTLQIPIGKSPVSWENKQVFETFSQAERTAKEIAGNDCDTEPNTEYNLQQGYFGAKGQDNWDCRIITD